jgi:hypothetical protein
MSAPYYGLLRAAVTSLSLRSPGRATRRAPGRTTGRAAGLVAGLAVVLTAGCGSDPGREARDPVTGRLPTQAVRQAPIDDPTHTEENIWTVLGLAKRSSERDIGPQTGKTVSPVLWEAARDTLAFAGLASEDPMTGQIVTNWYSPPGKPNERLKVSVFILSRALRSDSLSVTVDRQEQSPRGGWADTPVAAETVSNLETEILLRARQIHAERYRSTYYQ